MKKIVVFAVFTIAIGAIIVFAVRSNESDSNRLENAKSDSKHADTTSESTKTISDNRRLRPTPVSNLPRTLQPKPKIKNPLKRVDQPSEEVVYKDPINQKVLGPQNWMAKTDSAEKQKISDTFARHAKKREKRVNSKTRQNSIDAMQAGVASCLEEYRELKPDATGRIIVQWNAQGSSSGFGKVADVAVTTNMGLRDEQFENCVTSLSGLRFEGDIGRNVTVEYPFMFDE